MWSRTAVAFFRNWRSTRSDSSPVFKYLDEADVGFLIECAKEQFPDAPHDLMTLHPGVRGKSLLGSSLAAPQWPYIEKMHEKAAALHFSLTKNHPFLDGNKRIAVAATEAFLILNMHMLIASDRRLLHVSLDIASGAMTRPALIEFYRQRCVRLTDDVNLLAVQAWTIASQGYIDPDEILEMANQQPKSLLRAEGPFKQMVIERARRDFRRNLGVADRLRVAIRVCVLLLQDLVRRD